MPSALLTRRREATERHHAAGNRYRLDKGNASFRSEVQSVAVDLALSLREEPE
jgi:hypothetical protein